MMLSAVLTLKTTGPRDAGNLGHARNLLDTLDAFWRGDAPLPLAVYCPTGEVDAVRRVLVSTPHLDITLHAEEALLPGLANFPKVDGWFKQQALKMAFAANAPTPFYLTFDADILCCRPFDAATFIEAGRAAMDYDHVALHPGWIRESARILGLGRPLPSRIMGVTPHIFHAATMRDLIARLNAAGPGGWLASLMATARWHEDQWTESSLYWLHAWDSGALERHHQPDSGGPQRLHSEIDMWVAGQHPFETWDPPAYVARGGPGHFIVCQSTAGHDPLAVRRKIAPFLKAL